jgi:hypothetical protein
MTFGLKTAGQWPQQLWRRFAATMAALFLSVTRAECIRAGELCGEFKRVLRTLLLSAARNDTGSRVRMRAGVARDAMDSRLILYFPSSTRRSRAR